MESSSVEVGPDVSGAADSSQGPGKANTIDSAVRLRPNWLPRRRIVISIAILAISAVCASLLFHFLVGTRSRTAASRALPPATGPQFLRLKGMTAAIESRSIQAPQIAGQQVSMLTITKMVPAGTRVKKGDLLVEFDRQAQMRDFIDKQAQSDDENQKVIEEQAKEAAARAKDETEIIEAENSLAKAKLEMQKVELLSRIDAEKAQEDLDEAEATLAQLKQSFDLKRKAAQASIRILEIQRDRTRETMLHAEANSTLMQIRAPIDGIVVLNTIWKQGNMGEAQEGDQVRPGVPFMEVVDPAIMEVRVPVNQEDLLALKFGERAQVHLDAYNDLVLPGRLDSIDPMGIPGDFSPKLRQFSVTFSIEGHDPRLMPDLSAAVDIDTATNGDGPK
jgi:HlyD family secretion protein